MPKIFGAKFPLPVLKETIEFSSAIVIPVATTGYLIAVDQSGLITATTYNVVEATTLCNQLVTRSGLLRNLCVRSGVAPGAGETFVYTVRINGAPTGITATISGAGALSASDLVNTVEVVVGNRITIQVVTSAAAAAAAHTANLEMDMPSTRLPFDRINFRSGLSTIAANLTRYLQYLHRFLGAGVNIAAEASYYVGYVPSCKGSLKSLVVLAGVAPGAGETFVYRVRVNGVNTAMTVTLSGAAQLTGTDLVNVVQVDPGNRITLQVVTSLAAAVTTHAASFDFEEGDYRAG